MLVINFKVIAILEFPLESIECRVSKNIEGDGSWIGVNWKKISS